MDYNYSKTISVYLSLYYWVTLMLSVWIRGYWSGLILSWRWKISCRHFSYKSKSIIHPWETKSLSWVPSLLALINSSPNSTSLLLYRFSCYLLSLLSLLSLLLYSTSIYKPFVLFVLSFTILLLAITYFGVSSPLYPARILLLPMSKTIPVISSLYIYYIYINSILHIYSYS